MAAALLPAAIVSASNAPAVSGSYNVVRTKTLGTEVQIRLHIHLANSGASDLTIKRMTLWDFSHHADRGGSNIVTLTVPAHAAADTTQEFTILRSDYQAWQSGFRPRLVLEIAGPRDATGRPTPKITAIVRLDRTSGGEGR